MKTGLIYLCLLLFGGRTYAQMGIGTEFPDPAAVLDVSADHRGVLIPRVALQSKTDQTTITAENVESLLLYNTTDNAHLSPGFYYWNGHIWKKLLTKTELTSIKVVHADYSVLTSDVYIMGNAQTQSITLHLPNPSGNKGKIYTVKKIDQNENHYLNVQGDIEGIPTNTELYTAVPYSGWQLMSDGTQWIIITKLH